MRRQYRDSLEDKRAQAILSVLLLILMLGLIAAIGIGLKTGKIVINPSNTPPASQVLPENLKEEKEKLLKKEKELKELEERLKIQQETLEKQKQEFLSKADEVLSKIGSTKGGKKAEADQGVSKGRGNLEYLAKLYSAMKPEAVAKIFRDMDSYTAAQIISRMGNRQAGKVLSALPTDKAIEITTLLKEEKVK